MSKETQSHATHPGDAMATLQRFFKNDKFAERANIELLSVSPGAARAKMTLHPHHANGYGTVQGGAIFTLADFAFAAASNSHGNVAVAINVSITFMKAGQTGTLWAEARGTLPELQARLLHCGSERRPGRAGRPLPGPRLPEIREDPGLSPEFNAGRGRPPDLQTVGLPTGYPPATHGGNRRSDPGATPEHIPTLSGLPNAVPALCPGCMEWFGGGESGARFFQRFEGSVPAEAHSLAAPFDAVAEKCQEPKARLEEVLDRDEPGVAPRRL